MQARTLQSPDDVWEYVFELSLDDRDNSLGIVSRDSEVAIGDVSVAQSVSLLYQHSTGGCVWNTTPRFAAWVRQPNSPISSLLPSNGVVVELGSGTGALAMLIHDLCLKYVATDQKALLKLASKNCAELSNVQVQGFDWETDEFVGIEEEGVVVACDTVYNEYLVSPFCDALESVWSSCPRIRSAVVAVQLRDLEVIEVALKTFVERFGAVECYSICPGFVAFVMHSPVSEHC